MIIWDEYKHGQTIFENGKLSTNKYYFTELSCFIRYLFYIGYKPRHVKQKLKELMHEEFKYLSDDLIDLLLDRIIRRARKKEIVKDRKVIIFKSEIDCIKALNNIIYEKIIFILLVYCKWKGSYKWFYIQRADIKKEAKLSNVSSSKYNDATHYLRINEIFIGKIRQINRSRYRNGTSLYMYSLPLLKKEGDIAFEISNYKNVVYRYLDYVYGGYFECSVCGGMFERKSNRQKKCADCAQYHPLKEKAIICADCGKEVIVAGITKNKKRCDKCQKDADKVSNRKRVQKARLKKMNDL